MDKKIYFLLVRNLQKGYIETPSKRKIWEAF